MSAWKLAVGTACGVVAFLARDWAYDNGDFVFWTLVALAGNFYTAVLTEVISAAFTPRPVPAAAPAGPPTPTTLFDRSHRRLATSVISLAVCLIVAYTAQRAIIGMYSHEYSRRGDQTLTAFLAWLVAMIVLFGIPVVASRLARSATLMLVVLRGGGGLSPQATQVVGHIAAVAFALLALFLGWQSISRGIDEACAKGTYPFGCPSDG